MKKRVEPGVTPDVWDANALYTKAQRYAQRMSSDDDDWAKALWSSLALELLARSALSNVSPVLLADPSANWSNIYHALGFTPKEERFSPRSIAINEVLQRLSKIFDNFTAENVSFCIQHTGRRNAELHSGEAAFDGIADSAWRAPYYRSCEILLETVGLKLKDFVGNDEAAVAIQLIKAAADESSKAVKGDVAAHERVWSSKDKKEKEELTNSAKAWATRQTGHRVNCPACKSIALVFGDPISAPTQKLEDGVITEKQEYLPNRFECVACRLKILGLSRLTVVGLGDRYRQTQTYDAAEYYSPEDQYAQFDDDNNEY